MQWLFFEDQQRLRTRGQAALDVMSQHLTARRFFVGERYGVADIALFAYTQSAETLGFQISRPVAAWLDRVRAQPGYVPRKRDPLGRAPESV